MNLVEWFGRLSVVRKLKRDTPILIAAIWIVLFIVVIDIAAKICWGCPFWCMTKFKRLIKKGHPILIAAIWIVLLIEVFDIAAIFVGGVPTFSISRLIYVIQHI
jgi:hypothetical protein